MLNLLTARLARTFDTIPPASISSTAFLLATGAALGFGLPLGLAHPYDWALHGAFFALLTVSMSGLFQGRALPAFVIAVLLAVGGEVIQGALAYREMSIMDGIAGIIGALSAAGVLSIRVSAPYPDENLGFIERERALRGIRD